MMAYRTMGKTGARLSSIFEAMNLKNVWGLENPARKMYAEIGTTPWVKGNRADACIECGECEEKCPQKIPITSPLAESRKALV